MVCIGVIGAMEEEVASLINQMEDAESKTMAGMTFNKGKLWNQDAVVVQSGIGKVNMAICTQISSDALQHDFDVTGLGYKKSVIPGMETSVFTADTELVEMAKEACEIVNPEIQCFVGRVVTGDQFISDNGTKAALVKDYDGYCAEMEGASMAQVATLNKIPFVIIRAISDKADNSAPVAYETFEEQAIVHTVKLLAAMFLKMSK